MDEVEYQQRKKEVIKRLYADVLHNRFEDAMNEVGPYAQPDHWGRPRMHEPMFAPSEALERLRAQNKALTKQIADMNRTTESLEATVRVLRDVVRDLREQLDKED